jgi:hypothetical protein
MPQDFLNSFLLLFKKLTDKFRPHNMPFQQYRGKDIYFIKGFFLKMLLIVSLDVLVQAVSRISHLCK